MFAIRVFIIFKEEQRVLCMSDHDDRVLLQDDEKKNKKKQSPVDDRPSVPSPSEAMLQSKCINVIITLRST